MAVKNIELLKTEKDLSEIKKSLDDSDKVLLALGAAIEEIKIKPADEALAADYDLQVSKLMEKLKEMDVKHKKLLAECNGIIAQQSEEQLIVKVLQHRFNTYGCSLLLNHDTNNKPMYKFDFGNGRSITTTLKDGRLALVEMCPENECFAKIQKYLYESQDLCGLLANFGGFVANVN